MFVTFRRVAMLGLRSHTALRSESAISSRGKSKKSFCIKRHRHLKTTTHKLRLRAALARKLRYWCPSPQRLTAIVGCRTSLLRVGPRLWQRSGNTGTIRIGKPRCLGDRRRRRRDSAISDPSRRRRKARAIPEATRAGFKRADRHERVPAYSGRR
jgi:hypothetical protein